MSTPAAYELCFRLVILVLRFSFSFVPDAVVAEEACRYLAREPSEPVLVGKNAKSAAGGDGGEERSELIAPLLHLDGALSERLASAELQWAPDAPHPRCRIFKSHGLASI